MSTSKWMRAQLEKWVKSHPIPNGEDAELMSLWKEAKQRFRERLFTHELEDAEFRAEMKIVEHARTQELKELIRNKDFASVPWLEKYSRHLCNKGGNGGAIYPMYFVTVNVKPGITLEKLAQHVEKYVHRKIVRHAEWVYEQRASTEAEMGYGHHVHILVKQRGDLQDGKFKQDTRNTFKSLVGIPALHIDIKDVKAEYVEDKRIYMRGNKTGEGKAAKVAIDVLWRAKNSLNSYYEHGNEAQGHDSTEAPEGSPEEAEHYGEASSWSDFEDS